MFIHASTVRDNYAVSQGGGLSLGGAVEINSSTFSGNEAGSSGGAIRSFGGVLTLENSTLYGNIAGNRGAGISTTAQVNMNFCTVVNNVATDIGGGARVIGGSFTVANSIIAQNTGSGDNDVSLNGGAFFSDGHNFVGDTSGSVWSAAPGDLLGYSAAPLDPQLAALALNGGTTETVELMPTSPCVDQANATGAPGLDQRGWMRVYGAAPDIGAYELQPPLGVEPAEGIRAELGGQKERINLYPNPVSDQMILAFSKRGNYRVSIGNLWGITLYQADFREATQAVLKVAGLPSGTYWLKVGGDTFEERIFLIQR